MKFKASFAVCIWAGLQMHPALANNPETCFSVADRGLVLDIKASGLVQKKEYVEAIKAYDDSENAWVKARQLCTGEVLKQASEQLEHTRKARQLAIEQVEPAGCKQANKQANGLLDLTREAWGRKQWSDAATWAKKTELALSLVAQQCVGERKEQSLQKMALIKDDLHNAMHCGPLWEQASDLTAKLKQDISGLSSADKEIRQDALERAWEIVAQSCRGPVSESAANAVRLLQQARGTRTLNSAPPAKEAANPTYQNQAGINYAGAFSSDGEGRVSGSGTVLWPNGDRYEGDLLSGRPNGKGIFKWSSGQQYEGDFVDGKPNGKGKMIFSNNGERYEGDFLNGNPDGVGRYFWKNGDQYQGEWKNGLKHGKGKYSWANGQSVSGEYINDFRKSGEVVQVSPIDFKALSEQILGSK